MVYTNDAGVAAERGTLSGHSPFPRTMTLLEQATDLQQKAASPTTVFEALDTYYADDVEIVEATGETFHGKGTQRGRIREFLASIREVHGGEIKAIAAYETSQGTGVVFAESAMDATFKADGTDPSFEEGGRVTIEEVAVQQWKDGKVVHERFYYTPPPGTPPAAVEE